MNFLIITKSDWKIESVKINEQVIRLTDEIRGKIERIDDFSPQGVSNIVKEILNSNNAK